MALLQKYKLRRLKGVYQTTDFGKFLLKLLSLGISRYLLPGFGEEGGGGGWEDHMVLKGNGRGTSRREQFFIVTTKIL